MSVLKKATVTFLYRRASAKTVEKLLIVTHGDVFYAVAVEIAAKTYGFAPWKAPAELVGKGLTPQAFEKSWKDEGGDVAADQSRTFACNFVNKILAAHSDVVVACIESNLGMPDHKPHFDDDFVQRYAGQIQFVFFSGEKSGEINFASPHAVYSRKEKLGASVSNVLQGLRPSLTIAGQAPTIGGGDDMHPDPEPGEEDVLDSDLPGAKHVKNQTFKTKNFKISASARLGSKFK